MKLTGSDGLFNIKTEVLKRKKAYDYVEKNLSKSRAHLYR